MIKQMYFKSEIGDLPGESPSINVPLLVGLLSGFGTLFLGILCGIIWFAVSSRGGIRLGSGGPGQYDDEQALLEEEESALEIMDDASRQMYLQAKAWIEANPPNSANSDISLSQFMTIQEKGVSAWEFDVDFSSANCFVEARTEIEFYDSICSVQTNLPIPKQNEVYYWEAKIYEKPAQTNISIGLTTKPYPMFRLPGYHRYSVAYDSTGVKRNNQPFSAPHYGPPIQQGDVVGVGYRPRTGTVFFTRNGKKLEDALHGMRLNLFPTIGATGPCTVVVNFGRAGFVYIEANVKKWGLAPVHGSLAPPPPYGAEGNFVLLESGRSSLSPTDSDDNINNISPPPFQRSPTADSMVFSDTQNPDSINLTRFPTRNSSIDGYAFTSPDQDQISPRSTSPSLEEAAGPSNPEPNPLPPSDQHLPPPIPTASPPPSYTSNSSDEENEGQSIVDDQHYEEICRSDFPQSVSDALADATDSTIST